MVMSSRKMDLLADEFSKYWDIPVEDADKIVRSLKWVANFGKGPDGQPNFEVYTSIDPMNFVTFVCQWRGGNGFYEPTDGQSPWLIAEIQLEA